MTNIISTAVAILGVVALGYVLLNSAAMPDVHVSYSTDACVKVINYDENDNYSCENMPTKYNHVWVK